MLACYKCIASCGEQAESRASFRYIMAQIKDIFSRLYKIIFDIFFYTAVSATVLGLLPDHLFTKFSHFKPVIFQNDHLFRGLQGQKWNNDLVSKAKLIGVGELYGPESMIVIDEYIFTGLADGRLVKIHKTTEKIEEVVQFGNSANGCGEHLKYAFLGRDFVYS